MRIIAIQVKVMEPSDGDWEEQQGPMTIWLFALKYCYLDLFIMKTCWKCTHPQAIEDSGVHGGDSSPCPFEVWR